MKQIGIGYERYPDFIDRDLYFVDKTLLIRDVVEKGGIVTLFTRPRRFGKTLALSMLRTFFERELDRDGNVVDNSRYFAGMKIMGADEKVLSMQGQYPVIKLSLKSAKQPDFFRAFLALRGEIADEFQRHDYLGKSEALDEGERRKFLSLCSSNVQWIDSLRGLNQEEKKEVVAEECGRYATAIKTLSQLLKKHHGRNAIILLDEYDVPLESAWHAGFYDEMVSFIRSLFESALKTNDALERAVVTGCLRISRESIFTGMNNLDIVSVRREDFAEGFGFTQEETEELLTYYGLEEKLDEVREWYDGYLFGSTEIYNPWSLTNYTRAHLAKRDALPEPYWSNTSSNLIIKELVYQADDAMKVELDNLIAGGTVEKRIHEDITYRDIHESKDNLWNFLFFTGYMKKVSERADRGDIYMTMRIPNIEIESIYRDQILTWFDKVVGETGREALYQAIRDRDAEGIGNFLSALLDQCISIRDNGEAFYQGFFLSLLYGFPHYAVRSNRESGEGYPDIILYPNRPQDPAYLFELKVRKKFSEMQGGLTEALRQIKEKKYEEGILEEGYIGSVSFGLCFCKKSCIAGNVGA